MYHVIGGQCLIIVTGKDSRKDFQEDFGEHSQRDFRDQKSLLNHHHAELLSSTLWMNAIFGIYRDAPHARRLPKRNSFRKVALLLAIRESKTLLTLKTIMASPLNRVMIYTYFPKYYQSFKALIWSVPFRQSFFKYIVYWKEHVSTYMNSNLRSGKFDFNFIQMHFRFLFNDSESPPRYSKALLEWPSQKREDRGREIYDDRCWNMKDLDPPFRSGPNKICTPKGHIKCETVNCIGYNSLKG